MLNRPTGQPADNRHHRLEESEVEGETEDMPSGYLSDYDAGNDRHGESVHGQADSDEDYFNNIQSGFSPVPVSNMPVNSMALNINGTVIIYNKMF